MRRLLVLKFILKLWSTLNDPRGGRRQISEFFGAQSTQSGMDSVGVVKSLDIVEQCQFHLLG